MQKSETPNQSLGIKSSSLLLSRVLQTWAHLSLFSTVLEFVLWNWVTAKLVSTRLDMGTSLGGSLIPPHEAPWL